MKSYKSYKRVTKSNEKLQTVTKKLQRSYRNSFRGVYSRFIEQIAYLYTGCVGPTTTNMGDLIRALCGQLTPTPKSRCDLIWILCAHLQQPPQRVGVISFGRYVATFAPHLKVQQSCHRGGHLWPPCRRDVGVKACCTFMLIRPPGRVRSLDSSFVAICVQPPPSCTPSLQGVCRAFGMFVLSPVRGCLLGLVCVRWGSMTLDVHRGYLSCLRYSMAGGSRCAPVLRRKRLLAGCVVGWEGGPIAFPTPHSIYEG